MLLINQIGKRSAHPPYIFLRYCPPTWNMLWVIWPSEQYFTASINSSKMFSFWMAACWILAKVWSSSSVLAAFPTLKYWQRTLLKDGLASFREIKIALITK
jgi:hypothetical protein